MVTLRRASERSHQWRSDREAWLTFHAHDLAAGDPIARGFESLEHLDERLLGAGASVPRQRRGEAEIVTYVREGALAYEDSSGRSGVVQAGEFQLMTAGRGVRHSETNASTTERAHAFTMWFRPAQAELVPCYGLVRFSAAERRGTLCVVASPDGRRGSLRIHQDVRVYSAILDHGQHVIHELAGGRVAWIHLVEGEASLGDIVLAAGDGAGVTAERSVALTARAQTEVLLIDLAGP
jgi:quercetin 2,3-dioxygenase